MKWVPIAGNFDIGKLVTFRGTPTTFTTETGDSRVGLGYGLAISDATFSEGEISADFEFDKVSQANAGEIVFYYDPSRHMQVSAGIGGPNGAFTIRHFDGSEWHTHAAGGARINLKAKYRYHVQVSVRGSRVGLAIDGVDVLGVVLPFSLPPSQVGVFCLDDANVRIANFAVVARQSKVFVVMQFGSPFNEIHEEVIKGVCAEFDLRAHRADETYGPGLIIADITREIAESEFIIAEITPANPNVYYELGYSHAINKPAILLADRNVEKLPFDVSPFRVLFYDNSIAGKRIFEEGLRRHISAILLKPPLPLAAPRANPSR